MEVREWVELALIGVIGIVGTWFKGEHARIKKQINDIEKDYSEINTRLTVMESQQKTTAEHLDAQFSVLNKRLDDLFRKFDDYEKGRAEFLEKFEFKRRE